MGKSFICTFKVESVVVSTHLKQTVFIARFDLYIGIQCCVRVVASPGLSKGTD